MSDGRREASEVRISEGPNGVAVVVLLGEHDLATAEEIRMTLAQLLESATDVVIDLSQTEFIDTSTIHALDDAQRLAGERGKTISFRLPGRSLVRRVLQITGAIEAWSTFAERSDALYAMRPQRLSA